MPDADAVTAHELDVLAESLFWQDRQAESLETWRRAYAAHIAAGDIERATHAVWRVFCEHFLLGEATVAGGWLERGRRHAADVPGSAADGFIAVACSMWAGAGGDLELAAAEARRARAIGVAAGDRDVTVLAMATEGRALVDLGRVEDGMSALDDAMVSLISEELGPLYTGWIYCLMLSTCHDVADLRRAADWSDAAMRWCDTLEHGQLYPGLCRVYRVELQVLRGSWTSAGAEAERACKEIVAHHPHYAGEAFYVVGEIRRLTGDLEGAEAAYRRAEELGRDPQPGLADLRHAQGQPATAVRALRVTLQHGPSVPLRRAQVLASLARAELAIDDLEAARGRADKLGALAATSGGRWLSATAAAVSGEVSLAAGDVGDALVQLRRAMTLFIDLGMPFETARTRAALGLASREAGDEDAAARELETAMSSLRSLGAPVATVMVRGLTDSPRMAPAGLSAREIEVLRHVADGRTNREVGELLFISGHTVARHLSNIFAKLGVRSRAAATSYAHEHGLV